MTNLVASRTETPSKPAEYECVGGEEVAVSAFKVSNTVVIGIN